MVKKDKWEELEEYLNSWLAQARGGLEEAENINEMERAVLEMTRKLGRRMFQVALESKGEQVGKGGCHACGGETKGNGREKRKLVTLVGEVGFERQRVRCKECGEDFPPLGLVVGLPPGVNLTLGMEEIVAFCSVLHPFRQTAEAVEKLTGVKVSSKEAHLVVGKRGEEDREERREELEAFYAGMVSGTRGDGKRGAGEALCGGGWDDGELPRRGEGGDGSESWGGASGCGASGRGEICFEGEGVWW